MSDARPPIGQPSLNVLPFKGAGTELKRRKLLGGALAAGFLALIAYEGVSLLGGAADHVTAQELAGMQADWSRATTEGIQVQLVENYQVEAAVITMELPPARAAALIADVQAHRQELIWLTVWDSMAEDGDTIGLASGGVRVVVRLAKTPKTIALPRPVDGAVVMDGVYDGGGGITVGISPGFGQILIPPFETGATVRLPVR
jgi:hypothetical protein